MRGSGTRLRMRREREKESDGNREGDEVSIKLEAMAHRGGELVWIGIRANLLVAVKISSSPRKDVGLRVRRKLVNTF